MKEKAQSERTSRDGAKSRRWRYGDDRQVIVNLPQKDCRAASKPAMNTASGWFSCAASGR